jgi:hypothetical protein
MKCETCKKFESVEHLIFKCIGYRAIRDEVAEIFEIYVQNFKSVAYRWLYNKRFMHFNVISSTILWGLWINRINLVFNKVTWINIKQVWRLVFSGRGLSKS